MNRILLRAGLAIVLAAGAIARAEEKPQEPWLSYEQHGGLTAFRSMEVTIEANGAVHVVIKGRSEGDVDYKTTLTRGEMGWFRMLVKEARFEGGKQTQPMVGDMPEITIRVREEGKVREASLANDDSLGSLALGIGRLSAQAIAIKDLERGSTYTADGAVNSLLAAPKALQPAAMIEPLTDYVLNHDENVEWAIEALAYSETPEAFVGTISDAINKREGKTRMQFLGVVSGHPLVANIPAGHMKAMLPMLRAELKKLGEPVPEEGRTFERQVKAAEGK